MRAIPMALTSDAGRASVSTICKLVNLYPERSRAESENPVSLIFTPGLVFQFKIEDEGGIIGGIETPEGSFFCTRKGLYSIKGNNYVKKASVSLVGRVSIASNGLSLMIVDGYKAYGYSIQTGMIEEIDIPRSDSVVFTTGFFVVSYRNSNQFACSAPYSTKFDPLQFAAAEGSPDNIRGIALLKRQAYILGGKSTEVWYVSGEDFPLNPNQSAYIDIGCYTSWSYTYNVNGVFWLGDDKIVYAATGYVPQRISTHAIEFELSNSDCNDAYMASYSKEGHDFIALILPREKKMMFYDFASGSWHYRESPLGVYQCVIPLGSDTYVGMDDGSMYKLDGSVGSDGDMAVSRYCITPTISANGDRFRVNSVEMAVQYIKPTSVAKLVNDMSDSERMIHVGSDGIAMSFTDDDGNTWATSSVAFPSGRESKYRWRRLGVTYRRAFKFLISSKLAGVWAGVSID